MLVASLRVSVTALGDAISKHLAYSVLTALAIDVVRTFESLNI